jgi:hypothetical protein
VKGGSWASYSNNNGGPWGWRMDFAVHANRYGKVQVGLTLTSGVQERRRKKSLVSSCLS